MAGLVLVGSDKKFSSICADKVLRFSERKKKMMSGVCWLQGPHEVRGSNLAIDKFFLTVGSMFNKLGGYRRSFRTKCPNFVREIIMRSNSQEMIMIDSHKINFFFEF